MTENKGIQLKVSEAIQDDVNKGIVRIDSSYMKQLGIREGHFVTIRGQRNTVAIVDRALPGDIGLPIVRMDGLIRRNSRSGIGEFVAIEKVEVQEAKKVTIALAREGMILNTNDPTIFKRGLMGRPLLKGDLVAIGSQRRMRPMNDINNMHEMMNNIQRNMNLGGLFGLGDLKFIVLDTNPKKTPVVITENTEIEYKPEGRSEVEDDQAQAFEVSYEDVGGLDDELKKIREMVELPLKHPEVFQRLGIEPPKGVLLHGPPGTGKTLLAKAVANETNSNFHVINGPEIMSKFYGESEANLRKIFEEAETNSPSIIFIDEIDSIATKREESKGEVERRVVAQLLALMDGLKSRGKVVVIAATNIPNSIDPALRRPGRFDRELIIGVPQMKGRHNILKIHTRNMPLEAKFEGNIALEFIEKSPNEEIKNREKEIEENEDHIKKIQKQIRTKEKEFEEVLKEKTKEIQTLGIEKDAIQEEVERLQRELDKKGPVDKLISVFGVKQRNLRVKEQELAEKKEKYDEIKEELSKYVKEKTDIMGSLDRQVKKSQTRINNLKNFTKNYDKNKKHVLSILEKLSEIQSAKKFFSYNDIRRQLIENATSEQESKIIEELIDLDFLSEKGYSEIIKRSKEKMIEEFARVTHGFVGADLAALAREAAMVVLRRLLPDLKMDKDEVLSEDFLKKLEIKTADFQEALRVVRPSALREVLIEAPNVSWEDVGGHEDIKQEIKEAVEWPLKHKAEFKKLGVKPPKGVLLYGPPGTGKTMLAKAVAKESEANFIAVKGPELLSKWVGESEKAVREVFKKARTAAPSIVFFDEIDSIAPRRGGSQSNDSNVTERVVNQLLTEMDGMQEMADIVIIAATNRPDILDTALLRPGRFDRILLVGAPDKKAREQIFKVHTKGIPLAKDVDLKKLVDKTEGYVGADIESIVREAAMLALRKDIKVDTIKMEHFEEALKKVRASVTKDIEKAYKDLDSKFRSASGERFKDEKPSYYG